MARRWRGSGIVLAMPTTKARETATLRQLVLVRDMAADGRARALRVAARVSLSEVARPLGVTESAVSRWETGSRSPRGKAAVAYGLLLAELAQRAEGPSRDSP